MVIAIDCLALVGHESYIQEKTADYSYLDPPEF